MAGFRCFFKFFWVEPSVGVAQISEKSKNTPISSGEFLGGTFFGFVFMLALFLNPFLDGPARSAHDFPVTVPVLQVPPMRCARFT